MNIDKLKKEKEHLLLALDQDHQDHLKKLENQYQQQKSALGQGASDDALAVVENERLTQITELEDYFSARRAEIYRQNTEQIQKLRGQLDREASDLEQRNVSLELERQRLNKVSRRHMSRRLRNFLSFIGELIIVILVLGGIALWLIQTLTISTHGFTVSPSHLGTAASQGIGKTLRIMKSGLIHLF